MFHPVESARCLSSPIRRSVCPGGNVGRLCLLNLCYLTQRNISKASIFSDAEKRSLSIRWHSVITLPSRCDNHVPFTVFSSVYVFAYATFSAWHIFPHLSMIVLRVLQV